MNGGNEDGKIDAADGIFSHLLIWIDTNHNGKSEPEELSGLRDLGIESLHLEYKKSQRQDRFGNTFRFWGKVERTNGGKAVAWDVFFLLGEE